MTPIQSRFDPAQCSHLEPAIWQANLSLACIMEYQRCWIASSSKWAVALSCAAWSGWFGFSLIENAVSVDPSRVHTYVKPWRLMAGWCDAGYRQSSLAFIEAVLEVENSV